MSTTTTRDIINEMIETQPAFEVAVDTRTQALGQLKKLGLPGGKQEEYRFTPVTRHLEKHFSWDTKNAESSLSSVSDFLIPELDAKDRKSVV